MPNFSAIVGHQRLKRYSRNEKGLLRSLKSSIEMSMWEVPVRLSEPLLQQSTIHVTLTTSNSGIHPGTVTLKPV